MSDDLVNQITLNFLISKQQLQKLNKKIKQKEEDKMKTDMEIYKEQFIELFNKMLNDDFPDDLLEDVKHSYTYFVEKSIYYLKMRATTNNTTNTNTNTNTNENEEINSNERSEEERSEEELSEEELSEEERSEEELSEEELISANDEEGEELISASNNKSKIKPQLELQSNASTIYKKVKKNTQSKGVDNIEQLPLDWFTKVRQTQKQHNIIPRKSDGKK
jgi:hypothetical protein